MKEDNGVLWIKKCNLSHRDKETLFLSFFSESKVKIRVFIKKRENFYIFKMWRKEK